MWAEAAEAVAAANSAPVTPRTLAPGARATSASATSAGGSRRLRACGEISNTHAESRLGGGGAAAACARAAVAGGGGVAAAGGPSTTQFFSFDSRPAAGALAPRLRQRRPQRRARAAAVGVVQPAGDGAEAGGDALAPFDRAQSARSSHQGHQQRSAGMATQLAW